MICCDYTAEHDIVFNCNEKNAVVPPPEILKQHATPVVSLNSISIKFPIKSNITVY